MLDLKAICINFEDLITLEEFEKAAILLALKHTDGEVKAAAMRLGCSRSAFYSKANRYGIDIKKYVVVKTEQTSKLEQTP